MRKIIKAVFIVQAATMLKAESLADFVVFYLLFLYVLCMFYRLNNITEQHIPLVLRKYINLIVKQVIRLQLPLSVHYECNLRLDCRASDSSSALC